MFRFQAVSYTHLEGKGGWRIHFEYSDDKGKTWKTTESVPAELSAYISAHHLPKPWKEGYIKQIDGMFQVGLSIGSDKKLKDILGLSLIHI